MKVAIITQEDYFFIPKNIIKIADRFGSSAITTILLIDSKGSINNKKSLFIRGFGLVQSMKYGLKVLQKKLQRSARQLMALRFHSPKRLR